jgi:hypothetical protein
VVSAVPDDLRRYAEVARADDPQTATLARRCATDGVQAYETVHRPLTPAERHRGLADEPTLTPAELDARSVAVRRAIPADTVVRLPDPAGDAAALRARSADLAGWLEAVADAFASIDGGDLLDVLAEHPEVAVLLGAGSPEPGAVGPEAVLALVRAGFARLGRASGDDADGVVSRDDLEAAAGDGSLPAWLRRAARWLAGNPVLLADLAAIDRPVAVADPRADHRFTVADVDAFLATNEALRVLVRERAALDTAAHGGDPDGHVSVADLEAMAEAPRRDWRDAARFLLDHPIITQRLAWAHLATSRRRDPLATPIELGGLDPISGERSLAPAGFALAVEHQALVAAPAAARAVVRSLPLADGRHPGVSIQLLESEGVIALAGAAVRAAGGSLTEVHEVIAHLPETTEGVRNRLITTFYATLADRVDGVLAGDAAGHPGTPGHPGANWLLFAPWASAGVGPVIDGSFSAWLLGPTSSQSQAAADGNQWIFADIGARFAAFVELVERTGQPSEADLEAFFAERFADGDEQIRRGFVAYAAVLRESDPVRRQVLVLQGNALVATHEQAGAQRYLEALSTGPDGLVTRYIQLEVGGRTIDVQEDLPWVAGPGNLVAPLPILTLDPDRLGAADLSGGAVRVGAPRPGTVDLVPLAGVERLQEGFPTSLVEWWAEGTGAGDGPDGLAGSGASSWPDPDERMWAIVRLFEQFHTEPALWDRSALALAPIPGFSPAG